MLLLVAVSVAVACSFNPLKAELNPICHLLTLLGAHLIFHVSRIRFNINRTLAQTIEKPSMRSKPFPLHACPEIYLRGKIRWHFGHIYMDKTGIVSDVLPP